MHPQFDAGAQRSQDPSTDGLPFGIVAEERGHGGTAARRHSGAHCLVQPADPVRRERIQRGGVSGLERCRHPRGRWHPREAVHDHEHHALGRRTD